MVPRWRQRPLWGLLNAAPPPALLSLQGRWPGCRKLHGGSMHKLRWEPLVWQRVPWVWVRTILNQPCKRIRVPFITNSSQNLGKARGLERRETVCKKGGLGKEHTVSPWLPQCLAHIRDTNICWMRFMWLRSTWSCTSSNFHRATYCVQEIWVRCGNSGKSHRPPLTPSLTSQWSRF